ncbi:MAG: hypothetical protein ACXADS_13185 [Candidatus Thorarchaeota archaeon]
MTYIYGPVSSWRYGRSLGVDIIIPPKKCTDNCVYCQLGSTKMHVDTLEGGAGCYESETASHIKGWDELRFPQ